MQQQGIDHMLPKQLGCMPPPLLKPCPPNQPSKPGTMPGKPNGFCMQLPPKVCVPEPGITMPLTVVQVLLVVIAASK